MTALKVEPNWTIISLAQTKSLNGEDIDENNKKIFGDMFNDYLHLRLIIRHEAFVKEANKGTRNERVAEETAVLKQTRAVAVSLITACLRSLAYFYNF